MKSDYLAIVTIAQLKSYLKRKHQLKLNKHTKCWVQQLIAMSSQCWEVGVVVMILYETSDLHFLWCLCMWLTHDVV